MSDAPWREYRVFHAGSGCGGRISIKKVSFNAEGHILFAGKCEECKRRVESQCDIFEIAKENAEMDRNMPMLVHTGPVSIQ
jgi:hypothetical protein